MLVHWRARCRRAHRGGGKGAKRGREPTPSQAVVAMRTQASPTARSGGQRRRKPRRRLHRRSREPPGTAVDERARLRRSSGATATRVSTRYGAARAADEVEFVVERSRVASRDSWRWRTTSFLPGRSPPTAARRETPRDRYGFRAAHRAGRRAWRQQARPTSPDHRRRPRHTAGAASASRTTRSRALPRAPTLRPMAAASCLCGPAA